MTAISSQDIVYNVWTEKIESILPYQFKPEWDDETSELVDQPETDLQSWLEYDVSIR